MTEMTVWTEFIQRTTQSAILDTEGTAVSGEAVA